ncbi:hypothetical protein [Streptomyces sp. NPDC002265]|uniref:hypothetical protein n=1 Tax=Streptomyces sp. NPDC002265 TaxID=3154415 RepID=UPI0033299F0E
MTGLPDRMRPPRAEGWFAEDLDSLPEAPGHTELIDGALVFMMSPQRAWHGRLVYELDGPTGAYAPAGIFRGALRRPVPFEISLDLDKLTPPRNS